MNLLPAFGPTCLPKGSAGRRLPALGSAGGTALSRPLPPVLPSSPPRALPKPFPAVGALAAAPITGVSHLRPGLGGAQRLGGSSLLPPAVARPEPLPRGRGAPKRRAQRGRPAADPPWGGRSGLGPLSQGLRADGEEGSQRRDPRIQASGTAGNSPSSAAPVLELGKSGDDRSDPPACISSRSQSPTPAPPADPTPLGRGPGRERLPADGRWGGRGRPRRRQRCPGPGCSAGSARFPSPLARRFSRGTRPRPEGSGSLGSFCRARTDKTAGKGRARLPPPREPGGHPATSPEDAGRAGSALPRIRGLKMTARSPSGKKPGQKSQE